MQSKDDFHKPATAQRNVATTTLPVPHNATPSPASAPAGVPKYRQVYEDLYSAIK